MRKNMTRVGPATYAIERMHPSSLTDDGNRAVRLICGKGTVSTFTRLYYKGTLYHSMAYTRGQGKRNRCVCCFNGRFGVIQKFCIGTKIVALVKELEKTLSTLLQRSGNPGRHILREYAKVDILSEFIIEVEPSDSQPIVAISIDCLSRVCVYIQIPDCDFDYVAIQPNNFEHH